MIVLNNNITSKTQKKSFLKELDSFFFLFFYGEKRFVKNIKHLTMTSVKSLELSFLQLLTEVCIKL